MTIHYCDGFIFIPSVDIYPFYVNMLQCDLAVECVFLLIIVTIHYCDAFMFIQAVDISFLFMIIVLLIYVKLL